MTVTMIRYTCSRGELILSMLEEYCVYCKNLASLEEKGLAVRLLLQAMQRDEELQLMKDCWRLKSVRDGLEFLKEFLANGIALLKKKTLVSKHGMVIDWLKDICTILTLLHALPGIERSWFTDLKMVRKDLKRRRKSLLMHKAIVDSIIRSLRKLDPSQETGLSEVGQPKNVGKRERNRDVDVWGMESVENDYVGVATEAAAESVADDGGDALSKPGRQISPRHGSHVSSTPRKTVCISRFAFTAPQQELEEMKQGNVVYDSKETYPVSYYVPGAGYVTKRLVAPVSEFYGRVARYNVNGWVHSEDNINLNYKKFATKGDPQEIIRLDPPINLHRAQRPFHRPRMVVDPPKKQVQSRVKDEESSRVAVTPMESFENLPLEPPSTGTSTSPEIRRCLTCIRGQPCSGTGIFKLLHRVPDALRHSQDECNFCLEFLIFGTCENGNRCLQRHVCLIDPDQSLETDPVHEHDVNEMVSEGEIKETPGISVVAQELALWIAHRSENQQVALTEIFQFLDSNKEHKWESIMTAKCTIGSFLAAFNDLFHVAKGCVSTSLTGHYQQHEEEEQQEPLSAATSDASKHSSDMELESEGSSRNPIPPPPPDNGDQNEADQELDILQIAQAMIESPPEQLDVFFLHLQDSPEALVSMLTKNEQHGSLLLHCIKAGYIPGVIKIMDQLKSYLGKYVSLEQCKTLLLGKYDNGDTLLHICCKRLDFYLVERFVDKLESILPARDFYDLMFACNENDQFAHCIATKRAEDALALAMNTFLDRKRDEAKEAMQMKADGDVKSEEANANAQDPTDSSQVKSKKLDLSSQTKEDTPEKLLNNPAPTSIPIDASTQNVNENNDEEKEKEKNKKKEPSSSSKTLAENPTTGTKTNTKTKLAAVSKEIEKKLEPIESKKRSLSSAKLQSSDRSRRGPAGSLRSGRRSRSPSLSRRRLRRFRSRSRSRERSQSPSLRRRSRSPSRRRRRPRSPSRRRRRSRSPSRRRRRSRSPSRRRRRSRSSSQSRSRIQSRSGQGRTRSRSPARSERSRSSSNRSPLEGRSPAHSRSCSPSSVRGSTTPTPSPTPPVLSTSSSLPSASFVMPPRPESSISNRLGSTLSMPKDPAEIVTAEALAKWIVETHGNSLPDHVGSDFAQRYPRFRPVLQKNAGLLHFAKKFAAVFKIKGKFAGRCTIHVHYYFIVAKRLQESLLARNKGEIDETSFQGMLQDQLVDIDVNQFLSIYSTYFRMNDARQIQVVPSPAANVLAQPTSVVGKSPQMRHDVVDDNHSEFGGKSTTSSTRLKTSENAELKARDCIADWIHHNHYGRCLLSAVGTYASKMRLVSRAMGNEKISPFLARFPETFKLVTSENRKKGKVVVRSDTRVAIALQYRLYVKYDRRAPLHAVKKMVGKFIQPQYLETFLERHKSRFSVHTETQEVSINRVPILCKDRECDKPNSCTFVHPLKELVKCRYYPHCRWGDDCRDLHVSRKKAN